MPKSIRIPRSRRKEINWHLTVIEANLDSIWMEEITGVKMPWSLPIKERLFNALVAHDHLRSALGKRVV